MTNNIVYLNGEFLAAQDAKISVFDRGFLFADAVYEVIPSHRAKLFMLEQHLQRLQRSLAAINLQAGISNDEIKLILTKLVKENDPKQERNLDIYLQISRGNDNNQRSHVPSKNVKPTIFATCKENIAKSETELLQGMHAITIEDERRKNCFIKATGLMTNTIALTQAKQNNCAEAILVRDGNAVEATSSNLFIIKNGIVITAPADQNILHGITRLAVLNICQSNNMEFTEKKISLKELLSADEVFITGSSKGIWPIVKINNTLINNGSTGPTTKKLLSLYKEYFIKNLV